MRSKEVMKKLADNYGTLELVCRRRPSSMTRLKNLLMSEVLFFKLFTASCCTLFTTISKIIPNATSHYSSPIMHIKYCYPKTKHII